MPSPSIYTSMDRIVGTPNLTHPDPLTKKDWNSLKKYDQASLAYVIRVVHNGGKIPWTPIEYPYKDYLAERDDSTRTWLQNTAFMEDMKDYLLDGIIFSRSGKLLKAPIKIPTQFMSTKTIE